MSTKMGARLVFCIAIAISTTLSTRHISWSGYCPEMCWCTETDISRILVNCAHLGLSEFSSPDTESAESPVRQETNGPRPYTILIDLSWNEITRARFSASWKGPVEIDLSHNAISTMANVSLDGPTSVRELRLSHNENLKKASADLRSQTLEILRLTGCSVSQVEEGFLEGLPSLKALDLSRNALARLTGLAPRAARRLDQEERPRSAGHPQLELLNASLNRIERIEGEDLAGTGVGVLDVSGNGISLLRFTGYLPRLKQLNASANRVRSLDGLALPNAVLLDLSRNRIRDLDADFTAVAPKLRVLNLSGNAIRHVTFIRSPSISHLDLGHCLIATIDAGAFSGMENLELLDLAGNRLTTLRPESLPNLHRLRFLRLAGNPWECDCESAGFAELYRIVVHDRSYSSVEDFHCRGGEVTWSGACEESRRKDEVTSSRRAALKALFYLLASLLVMVTAVSCCKWLRDGCRSAAVSFENVEGAVPDSECDLLASDNCRRRTERTEESENAADEAAAVGMRASTPPPNYEAAILLPQLTEEQRSLAMSSLSLNAATR